MFERTYYATHPDMMECVSNEELRDRYLIQDLFREGECVLELHPCRPFRDRRGRGGRGAGRAARADRAGVRGGPSRSSSGASLPSSMSARSRARSPSTARPSRSATRTASTSPWARRTCASKAQGARFYLASCPAHKAFADAQAGDRPGQCAGARLPRGIERADHLPARHPRRLRQRAARHGPYRASPRQRLEHDAAAHPRAAQRNLFLFRAGRSGE